MNTTVTRFLIVISVLLSSCVTSFSQKNLIGNYRAKGKDYQYTLRLNRDSTFQLTIWQIEVKSSCEGTWRRSGDSMILLECFAPKPSEPLQGGYMSERDRKIMILKNRKLRLGEIELKHIK